MAVRIALPKGKLLNETAAFLEKAGWQLNDYSQSMRNYRLKSARFPDLLIKVFQEKDIPIQVAIGNYDLGICGLEWIKELTSKYAAAAPVRIRNLGYGKGALYIAASNVKNSFTGKSDHGNGDSPDCQRVSEYRRGFRLKLKIKTLRCLSCLGSG